jgi:hypothetical protein
MKLPSFWQQLPNPIKARFGLKHAGRQRALAAEGHLVLVLHKVPREGDLERQAIIFWRRPDGSWDSSDGAGLLHLIQHVDAFESVAGELTAEYKKAASARDCFRILGQVGPLHHAARNLYATLQAAQEAVPDDRDLIDLRDEAYDLERTLDLLHIETKHALDFQVATQAEEEARLSRQAIQIANRLNVLAAIFFPLMTLANIFNMNLRNVSENAGALPFWLVLLSGVAIGLAISWWVLRGEQIAQLAQIAKVREKPARRG